MQSAPVCFLIGLGYAMRSKRLRTTAVNTCFNVLSIALISMNLRFRVVRMNDTAGLLMLEWLFIQEQIPHLNSDSQSIPPMIFNT